MQCWGRLGWMVLCMALPCMALPVAEFSPDASTAGSWIYNAGLGVLSFNQNIVVDRGASSNTDDLVGAHVVLPTMHVTGSHGSYTLTPIGSNQIRLTNAAGTQTYMTGTLGSGNMQTVGTIGAAYSDFNSDISNVKITSAGHALDSAALDIISSMTHPMLDFELALTGASNGSYTSFAQMVDKGYSGSGGFSGAFSVPEPATLALLGLGGASLLRRRRPHTNT